MEAEKQIFRVFNCQIIKNLGKTLKKNCSFGYRTMEL